MYWPVWSGQPNISNYFDSFSLNGKQDISPSESVTICQSVDNSDDTTKNDSSPEQQQKPCWVCGDIGSGYHYNAYTCESCKAFFVRSIVNKRVYHCQNGNNCQINMFTRIECKKCRLRKCFSNGMLEVCVIPEQERAVRREGEASEERERIS